MNMIKFNRLYFTVALGLIAYMSGAAQGANYDLYSLSVNNKIEAFNRNVTTFSEDDKRGIRLSKNGNDGVAWLKHIIFSNGNIELDIRGKDENQQSFVGIAFHAMDNRTLDVIYFRPFNFQATDSVHKIHAVQYVAMPDYPWDLLRDKFDGKYENAVKPAPNGNDWFHVKIVVSYPQITVFVNGNQEPSLKVEKLNTRSSGKIGLWVGNNSGGDFANLEINSLE